jgi:hypothetical protein
MASNYGLNFGFRRGDEDQAIREGRYRLPTAAGPASGGTYQMGLAVEIDPTAPGFMRTPAVNTVHRGAGITGLLVNEDVWLRSIYGADRAGLDSYNLGLAAPGKLSVITSGDGVKVWFKNTAGVTRPDGRVIPAVTMVTGITALAIGDQLAWNGTVWAKTNGTTLTEAWLEVVSVNAASSSIEASLLK